MDGFEQERRGLFDGLQVPHSLNGVVLAALGLFVYWLGIVGIEHAAAKSIEGEGHCRLLAGMLANLSCRLGAFGEFLAGLGGWVNAPQDYDLVVWILFLAWTALVWAFFAGAINRIAAMKLAREEALELKDALRFGLEKLPANLLSLVFVLGIVGFFYVVCNATIGGWLGRIPYLGDVLVGILFFLVLVTSFLVVLAASLGVLGFNMASSAIATEASDTFDGVSRAWNYILARPWTVLLTFAATFLYLSLVVFAGHYFLRVSVKSLTVGSWGLGAAPRVVEVDDEVRKSLRLPDSIRLSHVLIPGKGDHLYNRIIGDAYRPKEDGQIYFRQGLEFSLERYKAVTGSYPQTLAELVAANRDGDGVSPYLRGERVPQDPWARDLVYTLTPEGPEPFELYSLGPDGKKSADDLDLNKLERLGAKHGPELDVAPLLGGAESFLVGAVRFWVNVARIFLYAYVVAYFLAAQTTVYFLLRKDVEGDEYSEIVLDEDEGEEGAFEYAEPSTASTSGNTSGGDDSGKSSSGTSLPVAGDPPAS